MQWKKKDIRWKLKQYSDVVVPEDEAVDVFKSKMLQLGRRVRLGDKEKHGLRFVYLKSHLVKLNWFQKIVERASSIIDPDGHKERVQARKDHHVQWDNKHLKVSRQWMHEMGGVKVGENDAEEGGEFWRNIWRDWATLTGRGGGSKVLFAARVTRLPPAPLSYPAITFSRIH